MQSYESLLNGDLNWALMEGSMHFEGTSAVHRTLRRLVHRLEDLGIDYAIAGGMALFFHGYRRFTEDVDVLVTPAGLQQILSGCHGWLVHPCLEDAAGQTSSATPFLNTVGMNAVRERVHVQPFEKSKNLRDADTGVKIDFLVTGQYPGDGKPGPIAFPDPAAVSEVIEGANVVELPRLIELKLASGQASHRAGDLNDVQRLIQALKLQRSFVEQLDPSVQDWFLVKWEDAQRALQEE